MIMDMNLFKREAFCSQRRTIVRKMKKLELLTSVLMAAVIFTSVSATALAGPVGDFDADGGVNGADANILADGIATGTIQNWFDMDGSGSINPADLDYWFLYYSIDSGVPLATALVDINFDGLNTLADFQVIQSHLAVATTQVTQGNLYADGIVDATDMDLYISRRLRRRAVRVSDKGETGCV